MCRAVGQFFDEIRIFGFRLDRDQQLPPPGSPMNYWWLMDKIKFPSWNGQKKLDDWFIRDKYSISSWSGICFLSTPPEYIPTKNHFIYPHPLKNKRNRSVQKTVFFMKKADPFQRFESVSQKIHQDLSKSQLHIGKKKTSSLPAISGEWRRDPSEVKKWGLDFFWEQISWWLFGNLPQMAVSLARETIVLRW